VIKLIVLDVDGTLTDGGIIYDASGVESKCFNVKDGFAIVSWMRLGMKAAIITGRTSAVVAKRAQELGISHLYQGVKDKAACLQTILEAEGLSLENVAAIGDDLNDYGMLRDAKRAFIPADASTLIDEVADVRLSRAGGRGAVAEMIEMILSDQNMMAEYLAPWKK